MWLLENSHGQTKALKEIKNSQLLEDLLVKMQLTLSKNVGSLRRQKDQKQQQWKNTNGSNDQ